MAPFPPGQLRLAARNRALTALRRQWPPERLPAIEAFERCHPGWLVHWNGAGTWWARSMTTFDWVPYDHPAGYTASNGDITVCGRTLPALADAITAAPPRRSPWFKAICCDRMRGI